MRRRPTCAASTGERGDGEILERLAAGVTLHHAFIGGLDVARQTLKIEPRKAPPIGGEPARGRHYRKKWCPGKDCRARQLAD